jgi:hypothetical protein
MICCEKENHSNRFPYSCVNQESGKFNERMKAFIVEKWLLSLYTVREFVSGSQKKPKEETKLTWNGKKRKTYTMGIINEEGLF